MGIGKKLWVFAALVDPTISNITSVNRGVALDKHTMQAMIGEGYNYNIITKALVESGQRRGQESESRL